MAIFPFHGTAVALQLQLHQFLHYILWLQNEDVSMDIVIKFNLTFLTLTAAEVTFVSFNLLIMTKQCILWVHENENLAICEKNYSKPNKTRLEPAP